MSHLSLDGFFGDDDNKSLSNLDWLDVNLDEYNNLPFDNTPEYISVPKLEQAWNRENDRGPLTLVPMQDFNLSYKPMPAIMASDDVNKLLNFTKTQMMAGKKGDDLINIIKEKSASHVIKEAYEHLKVLSEEQGLLGHVYVDPNVFAKCDDGAEFVRKRSKTAKYVLSMDKCGGCSFNRDGRCEVYKKHLASEVSYDQDLFDFYSKHFSNVTGKEVRIASKQDLKFAFTEEKKEVVKVAENKPSVNEVEKEEKTLEKKEKEYQKSLEDLQKALSTVASNKVAKDISFLLVKGYSSDIIKNHINQKYSKEEIETNKNVIASVLEKQGSLGKVYLDAALMPVNLCDIKESRKFFENNAREVNYVLASCNCTSCGCTTIANKKVVRSLSEIPKEAWDVAFSVYSNEIQTKLASIYEQDRTKGLRLAFIQDGISKTTLKASTRVESYDLSKNVDSTDYTPAMKKEVYFSPSHVAAAISKGFTLSKIAKTAKSLGIEDSKIQTSIATAFESHISSVNKYQIDMNINVPEKVKIVMSGKDVSIDLSKPLSSPVVLSYDSSSASIDTLTSDMDLKEASLNMDLSDSKYDDIQIQGLDELGF